jgi:hypothetical protein
MSNNKENLNLLERDALCNIIELQNLTIERLAKKRHYDRKREIKIDKIFILVFGINVICSIVIDRYNWYHQFVLPFMCSAMVAYIFHNFIGRWHRLKNNEDTITEEMINEDPNFLKDISTEDLKFLMNNAANREDYPLAVMYREELSKRIPAEEKKQ